MNLHIFFYIFCPVAALSNTEHYEEVAKLPEHARLRYVQFSMES
jgi:hypothetical protein